MQLRRRCRPRVRYFCRRSLKNARTSIRAMIRSIASAHRAAVPAGSPPLLPFDGCDGGGEFANSPRRGDGTAAPGDGAGDSIGTTVKAAGDGVGTVPAALMKRLIRARTAGRFRPPVAQPSFRAAARKLWSARRSMWATRLREIRNRLATPRRERACRRLRPARSTRTRRSRRLSA